MGIRISVFSLLLVGAAGIYAADADLDASIAKNRMGTLVIRTAPGAKVTVEQLRHEFWFGATLPGGIFSGRSAPEDIAKWKEIFTSHFNAGVPEADFKWDVMERQKGQVNYTVVDSMLAWADQEGITLRGHCIFWGVPEPRAAVVEGDERRRFQGTAAERGRTIGARYRDRFAEYDLNNEMMHADYYEQRFGIDFIRQMALWVKEGDPNAKLFVNDYDITTGNRLDDYVKHIRKLLDAGVPISGIGVQGHLHGDSFDPAALQKSLDELAQFNLPIRITEFNFPGQRSKYYTGDRRAVMPPEEEQAKAEALEQFLHDLLRASLGDRHHDVGVLGRGQLDSAIVPVQAGLDATAGGESVRRSGARQMVDTLDGDGRSARPGRGTRVLWKAPSDGERERDGGHADEGGRTQDGRA